jgi:hypothetical protein
MSLANLLKIPEHEDPLLRLHVSRTSSILRAKCFGFIIEKLAFPFSVF